MQEHNKTIRRGDIFYANLSPVVGCEQGGIRPVLILQNDIGNRYSPTVIAAAITSQTKKKLPTHVEMGYMEALQDNSLVLLEQIRTLDRIRLLDYIGTINRLRMISVDRALAVSIGLTTSEVMQL